jgi:GAF domain-containing protein
MGFVPGDEQVLDLEEVLAQVALALFERGTVEVTLQRIVDLAEHAVDGCEAAGIMLVDAGAVTTAAASSELVDAVDQLQIDAGEGPCIDAAVERSTFYAHDLLDDDRWPGFSRPAVEAGIRSVLAYSLLADRPSAINLYSKLPSAFGATDRAQGLLFATLARLAIDSAEVRATDERNTINFAEALRTRELIGQAQGILMERERITSDQAFDVLRRASQHMNIKLREVAATLVETGETPNMGSDPTP